MDYSAIFVPLITLIIAQTMAISLGQFRFPVKKLFVLLVSELVLIVVVSSAILILGDLALYAKWYVLLIVVPSSSMFIYISKYRDARDVFTIITTVFISFVVSTPAMWLSRFYGGGYVHYNIGRIVFFIVIFLIIHIFFRKNYLLAQNEITKGWAIFSILPFLGSVVLYSTYIWYGGKGDILAVLYVTSATILFMASVYTVIFYMFIQLNEKYLALEQRRILDMQNKAQWEQHILFKEAAEKSNRRWHDLRHTIHILQGLLESGDTDAAIGYVKDQMGEYMLPKEEYCQHPAVNSILCLWAERSRNEGISLEIAANIPEKLEIEPVELSALFANALENAYFACLDLAPDVQRSIKVEAHYNGKRLAIGITNTCNDSIQFEGDMPVSSKDGGGIGTRSMVYTVKRFRGAYTFSAKDGLFVTRFVLNV